MQKMAIEATRNLSMASQLNRVIQIHPFRGVTELKITKLQRFSVGNKTSIRCTSNPKQQNLRTCKNCKAQFDPSVNHPRACRFHTAHFGGETKRKFESVYTGGTMNTPESGRVFQYWHCCGSEDPFDPGCTAAPHSYYDD